MRKCPSLGKMSFEVKEPIFGCKVHTFLNYSSREFDEYAKSKWKARIVGEEKPNFDSNFAGFSTTMDEPGKPSTWIIVVRSFDWTIKDQGTLVHEIVHTVVKIFSSNNIPLNLDTQEFMAHSVGEIYERICCHVWDSVHRKKKKAKK